MISLFWGGSQYNLGMKEDPIVIFTAVELEARAIARALGLRRGGGMGWVGPGVELTVIGIRSVHVPRPLPGAGAVMLAGLAGALEPTLRVGDVVVDAGSRPMPQVMGNWRVGAIHTASKLISTPEEKAELLGATGALAVDMENAILRGQIEESAEHRGLPFLHVRAVSDSAGDGLDPVLMRLVDTYGRPTAMAVTGALLRRPGLIPHLRRVGRDSAVACRALGEAVETLVRNWP